MVTKQTGVSTSRVDVFGKLFAYRWKSVTGVISDNQVTLALLSLCLHLKLIGCYMVKPHGQLV
ncbi:MAG: hypothetical protein WCG16_09605, partial [Methylococcales bacterium]